ncbi:Uncharacterised protein [Mycobacteroides abscessus subsp. bolletii]|uniref:hypothetical protein n=1 Tax=Mycobacteroides abscessus TaxID=36809 RepID=UPI00092BCCAE|nr:hypothetical protein [Mycobacteroides abscessus]SHX32101.1 Uncharacterised protein [Mycobacteroides abscessus subsp. bolletii]SKP58252.1 Uncharacterised protein [Mycobacteroides abscessus subsp. bolletii]SKP80749.1 Uncharacterised protein [Mycobacteroides abscessus subsp. bolletii]SKQ36552.1 Uncharacterised protein [Mycobacteroides abscessus subsp. bolletii]
MDVTGVLFSAATLVVMLMFAAAQLHPTKGGEWILQQFARIGLVALSTGCFTALSLGLDGLGEKLFYAAAIAGIIDAAFVAQVAREDREVIPLANGSVVWRYGGEYGESRSLNRYLLMAALKDAKPVFLVIYYFAYLGSMVWWTTHMSSNPGPDWIKVASVVLVTANFSLIIIAPAFAAKERPAR